MDLCPCLDCIRGWLPKKSKVKNAEAEEEELMNRLEEHSLHDTITPVSAPTKSKQKKQEPKE
jgi:hypothetical protein